MQTLLVFDWLGEKPLDFYIIPDSPEWISKCHQKYINSDESEEMVRLSDAICDNEEYCGVAEVGSS